MLERMQFVIRILGFIFCLGQLLNAQENGHVFRTLVLYLVYEGVQILIQVPCWNLNTDIQTIVDDWIAVVMLSFRGMKI